VPANGTASEILTPILACAQELREEGLDQSGAFGVAIPGPFDYDAGIGRYEGVGKFESLYGVDVRGAIADALGMAPTQGRFINDADAFLIGEWSAGAARGADRAAGITLGTGIGSAFLDRGTIVADDPRVPPEGRVDLLRIDGRPLEDTVSSRAILRRVAEHGGLLAGGDLDVKQLADRVRAGDAQVWQVFGEAFGPLGRAIAPYLRHFDAAVLVVGGSMAQSLDLIEPHLVGGLLAAEPALSRLSIRRAQLGEDAGLFGAAIIAGGVRGDTRRSDTDGPAA
jgi:glucokinase